MRHGSLFSGIGGFDLAAEWMGWENVFHCEWNDFGKRILNYYWPQAISYDDITKTDFTSHRGAIDVLTGGFPCQPYSLAGKRKGKEDDRHLWPEMLRAIREIQPTYVVGENVYGIVSWDRGLVFEEVQADLEAEGYEVQPIILPAASVNAPHKRDRVWFIAHAKNKRRGSKSRKVPEKNGEVSEWDESTKFRNSGIGIATYTNKCRGLCCTRKSNRKNKDENFRAGVFCKINRFGLQWTSSYSYFSSERSPRESHSTQGNRSNHNDEQKERRSETKQYSRSYHVLRNDTNTDNKQRHRIPTSNTQREVRRRDCPNDCRDGSDTYFDGESVKLCRCGHGDFSFVSHSDSRRQSSEEYREKKSGLATEKSVSGNWENFPTQSAVCDGNDGFSERLDSITFPKWRNESIKAGGNAIVPQVVFQIFKAIEQMYNEYQ